MVNYAEFGPVQRWESEREPGDTRWATSLVGNPDVLWTDGSNETYATIQYGGYEDPWGHCYAQMLNLPMDKDLAETVTDVIVTWTARLVQRDPTAKEGPDYGFSVAPLIRLGAYEPDNAGPNWHTLGDAAWWGANRDSLYYSQNPDAPWEELRLPIDGSWKTFRERLVPVYTDRTIPELLAHDFIGTKSRTPAQMAADAGVVDVEHSYLIIYQDEFWSEDKFAVSEITIEFVGLSETKAKAGPFTTRQRFT